MSCPQFGLVTCEKVFSCPSLLKSPGCILNLDSISFSGIPRSRNFIASTNVLISRNRRPSRPMLAKSSSASSCSRSRAESATRVGLLRLGAKLGPGGAEGPRGVAAVDEGEYVGFESAIPIWCRRREKSPVGKSGSIASARTATDMS
jgi:hypothetical protein